MGGKLDYGRFESCKGDTPEQIQMCLHCQFEECINCLEVGTLATKYQTIDFDKVRELKQKRKRLSKADRDVLRAYPLCNSDKEIQDKTGRNLSTITEIRKRLGLPISRVVRPDMKKMLVSIWMEN